MLPAAVLEGLNPQQLRAVRTVRGPLCILAGAGSGKTTTITRRIAAQVSSGAFASHEILAVTFTDKAAGEMRNRLERLGVNGVRARTFHSAAAAQLHHLAAEPPGAILPTKTVALAQLARSLPKPYRFRPAADLATEIEWAKNRRISVERYVDELGGHEPPIPPDLMTSIWRRYEEGKCGRGLVDFEDLLELAIRMFEQDDYAVDRFQTRYRAFTVDEYQDVNLLQQTLLERWLGDRDDLCVVGDDYQSIYSFTGASPDPLLHMPALWPRTTVVKLETNYRSTPEVLELANRVARGLRGATKTLRASNSHGPAPRLQGFATVEDETHNLVHEIRRLHAREGVSYREMAILYRVNHRSEDYEEALVEAGVPFLVRDGGFLERQAARRILAAFRRSSAAEVADRVRAAALRDGWVQGATEGLGERELTRQRDLSRLVRLAEELDDGGRSLADFVAEVEARFGAKRAADGVNLLTLHRSKGTEFDAVFLPRLQEGELPFKRSTTPDALAEERRLFYVGITRARRHLFITWVHGRRERPSRFLESLAAARTPSGRRGSAEPKDAAVEALRSWRSERARTDGVPAYVVMHDSTIEAIARTRPSSAAQLGVVSGIGPVKVERYGKDILALLSSLR